MRALTAVLFLPLLLVLHGGARADSAKPACDGIARFIVIGKEPVDLGGSGRCDVIVQMYVKSCFYEASSPRGKAQGPFCLDGEKGNGGRRTWGTGRYMWSSGAPFNAVIIRNPPRYVTKKRR